MAKAGSKRSEFLGLPERRPSAQTIIIGGGQLLEPRQTGAKAKLINRHLQNCDSASRDAGIFLPFHYEPTTGFP